MNQILFTRNVQKTKITVLCIILIILVLIVGFLGYGSINTNSNKILKGVFVNSLDVGNMTSDEAQELIKEKQSELDSNTYVLVYGNREISLNGREIGLKYPEGILTDANNYGKDGNIFENSVTAFKSLFTTQEFNLDMELDENYLFDKINILLEEEKATAEDDSYEVSGDKIILTKGHDGVISNMETAKATILDSVNSPESVIRINVDTEVHKAQRIDFDELYQDTCIEKEDATYVQGDDGKVEYKQEVIGRTFDKDLAETQYLNLDDDDVLEIEFIKETPDVTTSTLDNVLFGDVLATFKTEYAASNVDRSTNLQVAASKINGKILMPGEVFSYNKEVGERTFANGFKEAHVFSGGKVIDGLGGGICQISSTLYNSVLMANLEVVERKNHMMFPEYVKPSLDATVAWGAIDFKFKNNRETPIKIEASAKNGIATVTIYGKKVEGEPIVELESVIEKTIPYTTVTEYDNTMDEGTELVTQSPVNGYVSKAYKILKDENGNQISRTLISSDSYKQTSKIVKVGTKKVEVPPTPVEPTVDPNVTNPPEESNENTGLPSGWDTPENPGYQGNN